jgi:hypothetical protein
MILFSLPRRLMSLPLDTYARTLRRIALGTLQASQ